MVPVGRIAAGAEMPLVAHSACYKVFNGVVNAARIDPDRAAAFQADHPRTAIHATGGGGWPARASGFSRA